MKADKDGSFLSAYKKNGRESMHLTDEEKLIDRAIGGNQKAYLNISKFNRQSQIHLFD